MLILSCFCFYEIWKQYPMWGIQLSYLESLLHWSVCSTIIHTHLSLQQSGSEIKWVDGGKPLFTLSTHLVSTVYTQVNTLPSCSICGPAASFHGVFWVKNNDSVSSVKLFIASHVFTRISICTTSSNTVKTWTCRSKPQRESWLNTWRYYELHYP